MISVFSQEYMYLYVLSAGTIGNVQQPEKDNASNLYQYSSLQERLLSDLSAATDGSAPREEDNAPAHLHDLLSALLKHLMAYCFSNAQDQSVVSYK